MGALLAFFHQKNAGPLKIPSLLLPQHIAAVLAASYPALFLLLSAIPLDHVRMLWDNFQIIYLALFIVLCAAPFFLYGLFISVVLSVWREKTGMVYASDLSGGAAGLLLVFFLMNYLKSEFVMIVLTVGVSSVAVFFLSAVFSRIVFSVVILVMCLFVGIGASPVDMSPYKGLMQALKDDDARNITTIYSPQSRLDLFENPRMKFAPGLSLTFMGQIPKGTGMAIDGEIAGVIMDGKRMATDDFLSYLPSALPYLLIQPKNVVIIGARNNVDLLQARHYGIPDVRLSEQDPTVLKALSFLGENQNSFLAPVFRGSGRNLLQALHQDQWLIFLSKTGFFPSGSFGLQEDYDLTVEAIEAYMKSLSKDGILFIQMFLLPPPRLELRLARNIDMALNNLGIEETSRHLLVYRSWDTVNFLVKRNGFSTNDLTIALQFLVSRQLDLLYPVLGGQEKFIIGPDYGGLFLKVLNRKTAVDFSSSYTFDIRETTDDRPFFYYFLRLSRIDEIFQLSGRKWAYFLYEGMSLPFILIFLTLFALAMLLFVVLDLRIRRGQIKTQASEFRFVSLIYFASIGFAFMFVEVFFIHRLILYFGTPMKAFSITLATILLSAGIGSLASEWLTRRKFMFIMAFAPLFIAVCAILFGRFDETPASAIFIIPIGTVLGLFFPAGIKFLTGKEKDSVPFAYATNGAASVVAPSLASLLAVDYGCNTLLMLAAILYTLALLIILPVAFRMFKTVEYS